MGEIDFLDCHLCMNEFARVMFLKLAMNAIKLGPLMTNYTLLVSRVLSVVTDTSVSARYYEYCVIYCFRA